MGEKPYKYRTTLYGHTMDVRAVAAAFYPSGAIITGSRDKTVRVWTPNKDNNGFTEAHCLKGPTNFVASICALPPSDQHPCGLILVGSHDCAIYGLAPDADMPIYKLLGHSGPVCALAAGMYGTVVSGSWDNTARVWLGQRCMLTLEGHQGAVWAVAIFPEQGLMLTGSADKTIRLWRAGKCERIFTGHEDCVRGLATLSTQEFLSCSNDSTIRHWQTTGACLRVFPGHSSFVYSICRVPGTESDFVTTGEDQTVRVWSKGECVQTLRMPVPTLWSVACLENGDIVVGACDGTARVFTQLPELQADAESQATFEAEIAKSALPMGEIGDLKIDQLPGKECLLEPGTRDGQTRLVREGTNVSVHQWVGAESRWMKIGDVVGEDQAGKPTTDKVWFEGKEYDYVFSVDVEAPKPLKLPYNLSENPWAAAQSFIHRHNLSQFYLDQIANFIIQNTKGAAGSQAPALNDTTFSDPFTGGTRYIPGTAPPTTQLPHQPAPAASAPLKPIKEEEDLGSIVQANIFPQSSYLRFDAANVNGISCKLAEFNGKVNEESQLSDEELGALLTLVHPDVGEPSALQLSALEKAIHWPPELVFPSLDLLRLAVRGQALNQKVCQLAGLSLTNHLLSFLDNGTMAPVPANQMLALRTLCNLFSHPPGEQLLLKQWERVLNTALATCKAGTPNKNVQIAACTLVLNYAVAFLLSKLENGVVEAKNHCLNFCVQALPQLTEPEAHYRLMIALGTLVWQDQNSARTAKTLQLPSLLSQKVKPPTLEKVTICLEQLLPLLS